MTPGETRPTGEVPVSLRPLGNSGLYVFPVALGTATLGWTLGPGPAHDVLDAFVDCGGNFINTSDGVDSGASEQIVGTWMANRGIRDSVVVAAAVGHDRLNPGLSTEAIHQSVDASLARLRTDHIDLLVFAAPDPQVPLIESLTAVDDLMSAGKVRALGVSDFSPESLLQARIDVAAGLPRIEACALEYSVLRQDGVAPYEALLEAQNIALMPYFVLANGYLGDMRSARLSETSDVRHQLAAEHAGRHGSYVLKELDDLARHHQTSVSVVAIAWALRHPEVAAATVGVDSVAHVVDIMSAAALPLSRAEALRLSED